MSSSNPSKNRVLFVCLGNICRSPTAEAVFQKIVNDAGTQNEYEIDSCGTGGGSSGWYRPDGWSYHEGESADRRMSKEASKRGYKLTSKSRPLTKEDLVHFDYIIGMDAKNESDVMEAASFWGEEYKTHAKKKFSTMCSYCTTFRDKRVPDPYYEGAFDYVLDLIEDASNGLFKTIDQSSAERSA